MCDDPNELPDGTFVACRKCELCQYNKVKDWAGRNVAQSKVSLASFACTLTYGPELDGKRMPIPGRSDHIRASVLTYADVKNCNKYLRWLGYEFQFFVTGELGGLYSRAHWHMIWHFTNKVPTHELNRRFSDRHVNDEGLLFDHDVCKAWPHGFMMWKKPRFEDVFYNCKYILKDADDEEAQRKPGLSKKPPIGTEYFRRWADKHVDEYLAPQKLEYQFPEIKKKDGSPLIFMLKGRSAEMYLQRYIDRWKAVHGGRPRPKSDLVDLFEKYGQVVTDEARLLLRREFPRGESRARIPSGAELKAQADEVRAEMLEREFQNREMAVEAWETRWIRSADSEQEQQSRQRLVEFEQWERREQRAEQWKQFEQYKAKHGLEFIVGQGFVRTGPGVGGDEKFHVWLQSGGWRPDTPEPKSKQWGQQQPTGPVGQWNDRYGTRPGNGGADKRADA